MEQDQVRNELKDVKHDLEKTFNIIRKASSLAKEVVRIVKEHELLFNSQGSNVDELLDLPIEPTKNFDGHPNINVVSDELFYDLRMLVDWTQEQKREIPKILKDRERIIQLNLKINSLVQENSLLTILSDKHKLINEKYKENIRL